ncbi:MAG TPA: iron donor protein CyaY [Casimicrobiaceae bacterium]|jgi:CyaY protein|nr:iron donor protein CyaY [Casimicrobiaceae bacterium]
MIEESAFIALTDRVLDTIGAALDAAESDLDWSENDGVLTIEFADGSRVIVNRHVPNRELWVAAKSGGFHFRAEGGAWRDTKSGDELGAALEQVLQAQGGAVVHLPPLPIGKGT